MFSFVRGQDSTMWNIIWVSPQGHRSVSVSRHFFLSRHRRVSVPCKNGSAETTVADGGRNPVARLWGRTLGENWPPELTSSYASIDFWCQLVASPATAASWMSVVAMVGWGYQDRLANCHVWRFSPPAFQWQPSFVGLAVQCWRALEAMGEV